MRTYSLSLILILLVLVSAPGCGAFKTSFFGESDSPSTPDPDDNDTPLPTLETKTIRTGDQFTIEPLGATPPFTYTVSQFGYLNTTTGAMSIPMNTAPYSEEIDVTDANGLVYRVTIDVTGFSEKWDWAFTQGAADQNFPTDAVWLAGGEVLVSAIGSDNQGERWATYRSTDNGTSWTRVDHYMGMSYDGESHPLAMAAHGTNVFVCGYSYDYNGDATEPDEMYEVRRSTDSGTTWTSADRYFVLPYYTYECRDIAVSSATGYVYSAGYADQNWFIRESQNNGTTWTTIYDTLPSGTWGQINQIAVTPSGNLFVMGSIQGTLYFLRGEKVGAAWTWTPATSIPAISPSGTYQTIGSLLVVDDNEAYYAVRQAGDGVIYQTTDAGDNWNEVYRGQDFLTSITMTSAGEIIASGGSRGGPDDWYAVRSDDNGATWTDFDIETLVGVTSREVSGGPIVAAPTGSNVMAFGFNDSDYQISTAMSADLGLTWDDKELVRFMWAFDTSLVALLRTSPTQLYAQMERANNNGQWIMETVSSSDNGTTWTAVDSYTPPTVFAWQNAKGLFQGHDDAIYSLHTLFGSAVLRRSPDGVTWTDVHTFAETSDRQKDFARIGTTSSVFVHSADTGDIDVYSSTDGTTWNLIETLVKPGGTTGYRVTKLAIDSNEHLFMLVHETAGGGLNTSSILKSTDGGANWTEIRRSTDTDYDGAMTLKDDDIYFATGLSLDVSTDGGTTWTSDADYNLEPVSMIFIDDNLYFYGPDPLGNWWSTIYYRSEELNTWVNFVDLYTGYDLYNDDNKYYPYLLNPAFFALSPTEIYLNTTYEHPYWGFRLWIKELSTGD